MSNLFSNIIHKANVRVANLEQIAGGLKEANRKRKDVVILASGSDTNFAVAPAKGFVEEILISCPYTTTSTSVNHTTVAIVDVTTSTTIATFDTYTNLTEFTANTGTRVDLSYGVSGGVVPSTFNALDLLAVVVTLHGTGGNASLSSSSPFQISVAITSSDKNYSI
jgi:hypothetical protein